eukprot:Gb_40829 [translate_table: standard]
MALEGNEKYVFAGLKNYRNVPTDSTLNCQTSSPTWNYGVANYAMQMIHPITHSSFKPSNSSITLDELLPISLHTLENINKGTFLPYLKGSSENPLPNFFRERPGFDQGKCNISADESSGSDQSTGEPRPQSRKMKRRYLPEDNAKDEPSIIASPGERNTERGSNGKRAKIAEGAKEEDGIKPESETHANRPEGSPKQTEHNVKPPEVPKQDYIHVRARRGQATDSHSLAERVRREKISERMKFLQDLVPGCNKVRNAGVHFLQITGKAVMLDEIINYVQSLQHQVEFLSMKLEAVNPRLDFNVEGLLSEDMLEPSNMAFPLDTAATYSQFHQPNWAPTQVSVPCGTEEQSMGNSGDVALRRIMKAHFPPVDGYGDAVSQISNVWHDDLQSVVQLGYGQNKQTPFTSQNFHGSFPTSHTNIEH